MDREHSMDFEAFMENIKNIKSPTDITINGKNHKFTFIASYYTKHYPNEEYFKIFFSDGAILEIIPKPETLFFSDDGSQKIDRNLIADNGKCLNINKKSYLLENSEDKQFIKKIYFGNIEDGEGECIFSDYSFGDEVWSLATLPNGEKSDVHVNKINIDSIKLDNLQLI